MGISMTQLLIILVIVILVFGTKRLKNVGGDLGDAIKGFRSAMKDGGENKTLAEKDDEPLEGEVTEKKSEKDQV
ncbi:twin-arginine translocase TatA/TatE family subunit [Methylomonas methanica]|uniref:Sec-independent protein translocase protein TatA n=1 Tax=Methylomonas methanica (strain DSM 25384 / MC09) TaxID=857087 RepID=G0A5R5_METMM|nr:twin-arginine translocase TatA/TatE family subunit [Methylomonas methanica]AEG02922.1 Sec-independent protein translocase protein tatA/E-like protein [Methylomonas methanica MC09]